MNKWRIELYKIFNGTEKILEDDTARTIDKIERLIEYTLEDAVVSALNMGIYQINSRDAKLKMLKDEFGLNEKK